MKKYGKGGKITHEIKVDAKQQKTAHAITPKPKKDEKPKES